MNKHRRFWALWGWPIVMGVLTTTGLLTALVSDTWGDWWSWAALGVPVAVMGWSDPATSARRRCSVRSTGSGSGSLDRKLARSRLASSTARVSLEIWASAASACWMASCAPP